MLYSRAPSIQGRPVLECARSINFSSSELRVVLYSTARSIRGAHSDQGNTVAVHMHKNHQPLYCRCTTAKIITTDSVLNYVTTI